MGEQITKPMSVARVEFIQSLMEIINNSKLPPFVIAPVLKDAYNDVQMLIKQQLDADMAAYKQQFKETKDN